MPAARLGPFGSSVKPAAQIGAGVGLTFSGLFSGLVGRWAASSHDTANNRLTDLSGRGNHAVLGTGFAKPTVLTYSAADGQYVYLPGVAGNFVSAADSAALSVTGDLELQVVCAPESLPPTAEGALVAKWETGALAYRLSLLTTGVLRVRLSSTGAAVTTTADSTVSLQSVGLTAGQKIWLVATVDVDNGAAGHTIRFYWSADGSSYSQLGADVVVAIATAIADTGARLEVGSDTGGTASLFVGRIYSAKVLQGIGGATRFNASMASATNTSSTFAESSASAATVTLNRSATGKKLAVVDRTLALFGTDDYLEVADAASLNFGSGAFTLAVVARTHGAPTSATILAAKKAGTAATDVGYALSLSATNNNLGGRLADGTVSLVGTAAGMFSGQVITRAVTRGAGFLRTYADTVAGSLADTAGSATNTVALRIGRASGAGTLYSDFELVAAAVWNRELSATEIGRLAAVLGA